VDDGMTSNSSVMSYGHLHASPVHSTGASRISKGVPQRWCTF